ncbi:MAG: enoyl-CoA hydratase/isomerase family protein [Bacillota bacterium]
MDREFVRCEYDEPLATVVLDRPEVLNAYNEQLLDELYDILEEVFANKDVEAVVMTGSGNRAFSVGGDIDYLETINSKQAEELSLKGHRICDLIEHSTQVVIAAVDGYALGGGMELTLACDMRIATTRARFGQPEVKLGVIPGFGSTQRLPRLIGVAEAKEMLFTGNIIDATLAYELGLINKVVTPRTLIPSAREMALEITDRSARAVSMIKKAINHSYIDGPEVGSRYETEAFSICFDTEEHRERIKKIKEIIKDDNN